MLSREFDIEDLGAAKKIFGMEIKRDKENGRLCLSQGKEVNKVLVKFNIVDAKPVSTLLASHFILRQSKSV